jgi:hypothetical protein
MSMTRPELSRGGTLDVGGARLVVTGIATDAGRLSSPIFSAPDGAHYAVRPVKTSDDAAPVAFGAGVESTILGVRPSWEMPASTWIVADPGFWAVNPLLGR